MQSEIESPFHRRLVTWATQLRGIADGVESVGKELEALGIPRATLYADAAAERVDGLSRYLETADLSQILDDVRRYAEEHPAIVAAATFGVGMATGRIIKAGGDE